MVYFSLSAMVEITSTQLICSNLPSPRALANALHRVQQAIGAVQPTTHRNDRAGARLRNRRLPYCPVSIYCTFAVFRMPLRKPSRSTTVDIAPAPRDGLVCLSSGALRLSCLPTASSRTLSQRPARFAATAAPANDPYEVSTGKATLLILAHLFPLLSRFPFSPHDSGAMHRATVRGKDQTNASTPHM